MLDSRLTVARTWALILIAVLPLAACGGAQSRKAHFMDKGRDYVEHSNYTKARVEFRNALQIAPNDPEVRYQNGWVAEKLGAAPEAAQFYQGALDVQSDHVNARARLGRLFFLYGAYKNALDVVGPGLAKHPDNADLLSVRAAARSRMNDDAEALKDAERAYKLDPRNEDTIAILVGLYTKVGRKDDARVLLIRGTEQIPTSVSLRMALVENYLDARDGPQAERVLKEIIAMAPKEAAHRINLAHYYAVSNRVDDAEATLREAIKSLPHDQTLRASLIDFLHERRGAEPAESELSKMIAASPDDDDLKFDLARLYASEKRIDKAEAIYRAVAASNHGDAAVMQAKNALASLRLAANDVPGAEALINEVLARNPRSDDSLALRAQIELMHGDPAAAIADLRSVLRDLPTSVPALRALAAAHVANNEPAVALEVMQRVVDANPADTGARLEVANLLNRMGKPEQAQTVAEALVRREPKNAAFLEAAFRAELGAKDLPAAEKTADALTAAYPDQSLGYHLSGLAAEAAGNEDAAIKDYQKALETQPSAREPLEALVRLYARTNKVPAALDVLHKAAESQPHNVLPTMLAGEIQLALKRYPEAIDSFQKALDLVPDWLPAYRGLAQAQLGQHNTDAAVQTLRSAQAKVHPADAAVFDLAGLYQQLGRPDAAIAAYEEALKINPRSDLAANNLAMLLVSRTDKASLDRALTLAQHFSDSSNARYVDTLGWVRFKRGETTNALPVLNKAVSLAPDAPAPRYHLAMAQLKSGQTETARSNLQQALKQGSTFEGASDAQLALSGLQAQAHADVPGR